MTKYLHNIMISVKAGALSHCSVSCDKIKTYFTKVYTTKNFPCTRNGALIITIIHYILISKKGAAIWL